MVSNFRQYIIENLSDDEKRELRDLGFGGVNINTLISEISNKVDDSITLSGGSHDQELSVATTGSVSPDDFGIMHDDIDRDFWYELIFVMDFSSGKMRIDWEITQKDMGLYETGSFTDDMSDHFGDYQSYEDEELAEQIADLLNEVTSYGDPTGAMDVMQGVAQEKFERMYGEEDEEDEEEEEFTNEKKRLEFQYSDAPEAKGKFKELGVQKLADWLIKTRGGNMQKITGSLNQQINFNKKDDPTYAKKMESTREAVKRKLAKKKE